MHRYLVERCCISCKVGHRDLFTFDLYHRQFLFQIKPVLYGLFCVHTLSEDRQLVYCLKFSSLFFKENGLDI